MKAELSVRLVLAISLDGRLTFAKGGKSYLGGKGDRKVLEESLAWCDGALIGAGTLRAHQSTCLIHDEDLIKQRINDGKDKQPISLIMSNQFDYPKEWQYFQQPIKRWIISSHRFSSNEAMKHYGYDKHIQSDQKIEKVLSNLKAAGLSRLIILGGSQIVNSFLKTDQIDEIQLTITPKILGGEYTWMPNKKNGLPNSLSQNSAWVLKETKALGNSELLVFYCRNRLK